MGSELTLLVSSVLDHPRVQAGLFYAFNKLRSCHLDGRRKVVLVPYSHDFPTDYEF